MQVESLNNPFSDTDNTIMLKPLEVLRLFPEHNYTLFDVLQSRSSGAGDRPFVIFNDQQWTYPRFMQEVLATARVLISRGVKNGDRVGVIARNDVGHLLLLFACARIGAIMVPTNPDYGVDEAGYVMKHADVCAVACGKETLEVARGAASRMDTAPWLMLFDGVASDVPNLGELIAHSPDISLPPPAGPDDTCVIIYTSGSTGFPKGAMHSQRNFITAGEANVARLWLQPQDRLMTMLPLFHVNALFYSLAGTIAAGASIIVIEKFSASTFWDTAVKTGATRVNFIDTIGRILKARPRSEFRPDHLINTVYGARPEVQECFRNEFHIPNLINGFGMTEIPGVHCNPFEGPQKATSLGPVGRHPDPARPWAHCRLVDDNGVDVPTDSTGELWVKHPIVMQGYFRDPEQTKAAFRDGWFMTGDLMRCDSDGHYYFVTRKKDIIRRRGENIAGLELDRVINAHPAVSEAAAIGVPSDMGDEEVLAAVSLKAGASVTAQEIADWCAQTLAAMKVPRYVLFMDELPHTATHKIAKHVLKADKTIKSRAIDLLAKPAL